MCIRDRIWILPEKADLTPSYEQKYFDPELKQGKLKLVASRGGDDGSVHINQDVKLYASVLNDGEKVSLDLPEKRYAWIQLISGTLDVNGETLNPGDGAAISDETALKLKAGSDNTEFLLFDMH